MVGIGSTPSESGKNAPSPWGRVVGLGGCGGRRPPRESCRQRCASGGGWMMVLRRRLPAPRPRKTLILVVGPQALGVAVDN